MVSSPCRRWLHSTDRIRIMQSVLNVTVVLSLAIAASLALAVDCGGDQPRLNAARTDATLLMDPLRLGSCNLRRPLQAAMNTGIEDGIIEGTQIDRPPRSGDGDFCVGGNFCGLVKP